MRSVLRDYLNISFVFFLDHYLEIKRLSKSFNCDFLYWLFYRHSFHRRVMYYYQYKGCIHNHGEVPNGGLPGLKVVKKTDVRLDECCCDAVLELKKPLEGKYYGRRYHKGRRRSVREMIISVLVQSANDWYMDGRVPKRKVSISKLDASYYELLSMTFPNMRKIPEYIVRRSVGTGGHLDIPRHLLYPYQVYDMRYFGTLLNRDMSESFFKKYIWCEVYQGASVVKPGLPWSMVQRTTADVYRKEPGMIDGRYQPESLYVMALRQASFYNMTYGGWTYGPNVAYTLTNALEKLPTYFAKLNKPTHRILYPSYLASLEGRAMPFLLDLLDVRKYKETMTWTFGNMCDRLASIPRDSSAGITAGPPNKILFQDNDMIWVATSKGKKKHQWQRAMKQLNEMYAAFKSGQDYTIKDKGVSLVLKNECLIGSTLKEMVKMLNKCRIFWVVSLIQIMVSVITHYDRQKLERGNVITIGMNWWSGGAQKFTEELNFYRGLKYFTADFSGLDTTIKAAFLKKYSAFTLYYYKREGEYDVLKRFLKKAMENLTYKCVHFMDDIWYMVYGIMPSGAFETSHGDSWIVLLIYCLYFSHVIEENPDYAFAVRDALHSGDIVVKIYGDDSVLGVVPSLSHIVNMEGFANFVSVYLDMTMRDVLESPFVSVLNEATGEFSTKGVVFLGRYMIHRSQVTIRTDLPEYLPCRPHNKVVRKYPFANGGVRTPKDHVLAAIGMVYDSMGTNHFTYKFCKLMYDANIKLLGKTFADVIVEAEMFGDKYIDNLMKKSRISLKCLKRGFPTRDQLLDMHVRDESKHSTRSSPQTDFYW